MAERNKQLNNHINNNEDLSSLAASHRVMKEGNDSYKVDDVET